MTNILEQRLEIKHANSVKTLDWDPCHPGKLQKACLTYNQPIRVDLLSTGGRDGSICVWDVRDSRRGDAGANSEMIESNEVTQFS